MSNYDWFRPRQRRQHLFIVEGKHEKNELMKLLLKSFPEIDMDLDDVIVYGTNIYQLYLDINREYEDDWEEVDLPFIVSKKKGYKTPVRKTDFINIVLVFDYERHDPNFSEEKILKMQTYFVDSADAGQLYLNYPMIESYQHLLAIPDSDYADRSVPVNLQPGLQYKNLVKNTMVSNIVRLPLKLKEILAERFHVTDEEVCAQCVEGLLSIKETNFLLEQIETILSGVVMGRSLVTAKYQLADTLQQCGYLSAGLAYYRYTRYLFAHIIRHNICKANKILRGMYEIESGLLKDCFISLDLKEILRVQNNVSRDKEQGFIWVLNTYVFFIPDYNFQLLEQDEYKL